MIIESHIMCHVDACGTSNTYDQLLIDLLATYLGHDFLNTRSILLDKSTLFAELDFDFVDHICFEEVCRTYFSLDDDWIIAEWPMAIADLSKIIWLASLDR